MKNFYDKVLFLLGLVLVGLGVFVFVQSGGLSAPAPSATVKGALTGKPYELVPAPVFNTVNAEWGPDQDQTSSDLFAAGWIYGVFTPPKLWWDKLNAAWIVVPPIPLKALPSFGLRWVGVQQEPYRIQFTGIAGLDSDPIMFFSDGGKPPFPAKKGDTVADHQIKVIDIAVDNTPDNRNMVHTQYMATIEDLNTKETITLTMGQPKYVPGHEFILLQTSDQFPQQDWRITNDKSTWELKAKDPDFGEVTFKVTDLKLSLDNPSVKVSKDFRINTKPVHAIKLLPESSDSTPATPATPAPTPAK